MEAFKKRKDIFLAQLKIPLFCYKIFLVLFAEFFFFMKNL